MQDHSPAANIGLTPEAIEHLGTTRKWTLFLAIVGFVYIGFVIFLGLISLVSSVVGGNEVTLGFGESLLTLIIYALGGALYFIPLYSLYKFSSSIKTGLSYSDVNELTTAFKHLKNHYASLGVLLIFGLVVAILAILLAVVVALR